jgi:hypothetical protein
MEQQDRSSLMTRIEQAAVALLHGRPTRGPTMYDWMS